MAQLACACKMRARAVSARNSKITHVIPPPDTTRGFSVHETRHRQGRLKGRQGKCSPPEKESSESNGGEAAEKWWWEVGE